MSRRDEYARRVRDRMESLHGEEYAQDAFTFHGSRQTCLGASHGRGCIVLVGFKRGDLGEPSQVYLTPAEARRVAAWLKAAAREEESRLFERVDRLLKEGK